MSSLAHHPADPFRLLVESLVEYAIFILDPEGTIASWNPGGERIYGYRSEEIIGKHYSCLFPEEDVTGALPDQALQNALENGHHERECLRVRKDGSRFDAIGHLLNLKDYFGKHSGFAEVTRDITVRKQAEEAVRRERDVSAAILHSLPGIFYMYDQNGHFVRWNQRFLDVTGYSAAEMEHLHPLDFFEAKDQPRLTERIENVFQSGSDEIEAFFISKNRQRHPYYFNGVREDFDGQPHLLGMGIDISTQRRAQEALRATDQRLRMAAKAANVGLWDWDIQTNQVFYSPEWKSQIGYEGDEIGSSFDEWQSRVHPADLEGALQRMFAFIADPRLKYNAEFRLRHRDGSYRCILSHASLMRDEHGKAIRMLGSHVDITEERETQTKLHQAAKMEAIGQLAAGVAHDFNNLLTVINGYSDLLLDKLSAGDPMRDLLMQIHKAGVRAGSLTRQLLLFSHQQPVEPKVLNLNAVVGDVERMLVRLIGEDVVLTTSLSPSLGMASADPGQIQQVLVNLAVNARDAMPNGGRLTIETRNVTLDESYCRAVPDLHPGGYVLLAVADNGTGMDAATKARAFEPFFTTKPVGKGTGLGLATVHGIAKQSGGHVEVYSEAGQGTTFKLYLPLVFDAAPKEARPVGADGMLLGSETILVAEDDDAVRAMVLHILRGCGYRVIEAYNGTDAVQLAKRYVGPIELLITDVVMPFLGGRELAAQIAATHPACKMLFLSGYADDALVHHGVLEGSHAFLQKPFSPALLARKVRSVLEALP